MVSARVQHALSEMNDGYRPASAWTEERVLKQFWFPFNIRSAGPMPLCMIPPASAASASDSARASQRQSTWPCQSEAGLTLFLRVWSVWPCDGKDGR